MTTIPPIIEEAESLVHQLATTLTSVREGECLCCYVARQIEEYPCDHTHRHALRYRDATAPRATAILERLSRVGACCCDCELFLNGYEPAPGPGLGLPQRDGEDNGVDDVDPAIDVAPFEKLLPCAGVRRGSITPCDNWVRLRRPW